MGAIGDLYYAFRGDGARLQKDAQVEGAKAGTGLGKSMAASLKKSWSGKEIGKGLVQGLGLAGGLGAAQLITMAIGKITDVLGDATQAALAEETSIQKLDTALRNNVPSWDGNTDAIERVLKARMRLGFSDDEQRASIATLVGSTKDYTKALELGAVAIDISRAREVDLKTASDAVAKAYAGNVKGLKSLLPGLKLGATSAETLANAYGMVRDAGEDYAKTNAGKLLVSQVKVGEALETLGAVTMPAVVEVMTTGAEVATDFAEALGGIGENVKDNEDPLQNLANLLHDMFKSPDEDARTFLGTLFDGLNDIQRATSEAGQDLHTWLTFWDSTDEAQNKAARSADHTADSIEALRGAAASDLRGVSGSMGDVGDASGDMADDIEGDNSAVTKSWQDLRDALKKSADDMIDDVFDPIITADRLRANSAELSAQRQILASKTATAAQKRDARDKIHQLEKDNAQYLVELAEAGATNTKAYRDGITELKNQIKKAKGPAKAALQEILNKIIEIERVGKIVPVNVYVTTRGMTGTHPGGGGPQRAAGGPQQANMPYWVGERGPEIHVPATDGRILSTSQSMAALAGAGGGGGDTTINVQLPTREAPDAFEVASQLRRLNDFGVLSSPR